MKEVDIKRLIVQLLIMRILKERFETQTVRGTSVKNVFAFIMVTQNRPELLRALDRGQLPVLLSDGIQQVQEKTTIEIMPKEPVTLSNVGDFKHGPAAAAGATVVNA